MDVFIVCLFVFGLEENEKKKYGLRRIAVSNIKTSNIKIWVIDIEFSLNFYGKEIFFIFF